MPAPVKRAPPKVQKDAYRFSDEDLAGDRDFQQALVKLSGSRDTKILATKVEVKSPLGPFIIPCIYQKGRQDPTVLVSQPSPWDPVCIKSFFSFVCRLRTTSEYISLPISHAQDDVPTEVTFLSEASPASLLAVDARVFYKSDPSEGEANFSAHAEDFAKILQHHTDFEATFRPETLSYLDTLIQSWYVASNHDYACLGALKNMLGFFYGEVFVRCHLGTWLARKLDGGINTIWIDTGNCRYNVIGKVWKAFKYGTEEESLDRMFQTAMKEATRKAA